MVQLYGLNKAQNSGPGFLAPRVTFGTKQALTPSQSYDATAAVRYGSAPVSGQDNALANIGMSILGGPVDIVDSLLALAPGIERGSVNDTVYDTLGMSDFGQWVRQNHGSVEVASGLMGMAAVGLGAEIAAGKLLTSSWFMASGVGQATRGAIKGVEISRIAATRGAYNAALGRTTVEAAKEASRNYVLHAMARGAGKALLSETAIVTTLNQNSFVWSEDMATNFSMLALGVGIGGAIGGIGARGVLKRWVNGDLMREAYAQAADPGMYERMLNVNPSGVQNALGLSTLRGPTRSAEFTVRMLNATRDDLGNGGQVGAREAIKSTGETGAALQVLQSMTRRGLNHVQDSKFNVNGSLVGNHIIGATREDPLVLLGAQEIGQLPAGRSASDVLKERAARIDNILSAKNTDNPELAQRQHLAQIEKKETVLFMMGRELATAEEIEELSLYSKPTDLKPTAKDVDELTFTLPVSQKQIILREDGTITNADWDLLHTADQQAVVDGYNALAKRLKGKRIVVPANPTFMQLDFALMAESKGAIVDYTRNAGLNSSDDAIIASLRLKLERVDALQKLGKPIGFIERIRLNLPKPTRLELAGDPTGGNLIQMLRSATREGITPQALRDIRVQAAKLHNIAVDASPDARLDGDIFNFNRAKGGREDGAWLPTLMVSYSDPLAVPVHRFKLEEMVAQQKALSLRILGASKRSPRHVADITKAIVSHPAYKEVSIVSGLDDSQVGGTRNVVGATASQALTQNMRYRHNPVLLGAQQIRRVVNRMVEQHIDSVLQRLSPHVDKLASVSGQQSRILMNQYLSYAPGWDIDSAIETAGGRIAFKLRSTNANAERWQRIFGEEMPVEATLRSPSGVEVVLDQTANAFRVEMQKAYNELLHTRNTIRRARGLEEIQHRNFYVPPPSTKGKIIGFTLDSANRVVPNGTIIASTREEFERAKGILKAKQDPNQQLRFVTQDDIAEFTDVWEQAMMDWVNPADFIDPQTLAAPKNPQRGLLQSSSVNPRGIEEVLEGLKHGHEQAGNGIVRTIFDTQLKTARIRDTALGNTGGREAGVKGIFRLYQDTLMGISGTSDPRGINRVMSRADEIADAALRTFWPAAVGGKQWVMDMAGMMGVSKVKPVKSFEALADQLGKHTPFANVTEYLEYKHGLKAPWKTKELARHANRFGAGVILRWGEIAHAAMNMTGIITTMPGVLAARNVPSFGRVNNVPVIDTVRIMAKGFARQFERNSADIAMMVKNGDMTQDVAELHHHMSMMEGKSATMRLLTGDPRFANWQKLSGAARTRAYLRFKGIEGMAAIITDTSENMSRRWAHMVGLELADMQGIVGMEARHNFARQIANDAIANYDPLNRPEIYQSSLGSMYGLFLSYAQNYYERMFRWIEGGDFKAIRRSAVMQSTFFGFTGLPGYRQLEALLGGEEDGESILDHTYKRLGPATAAIFSQGGFNQWTRLLGLPAVALHTRGDINFRHPAIEFGRGMPALPVGLEVVKDLASGTFGAISALVDPKIPNSGRYAAELIARDMPSRILKGAISVLALNGQEVDANGNIISDIRDDAEIGIRMLGLRSARQQAEVEAYFMNQRSQAINADKMDKVRAASRAAIHARSYDKLPKIFESYLDAGGQPHTYPTWIRTLIQEAQNTRGENQLLQMMRRPQHQALAKRIQMMTEPY